MQRIRGVRGWCALVALAGAVVGACETARNPGNIQPDRTPPTIVVTPASDTQQIASGLNFTVTATDNLGLLNVHVTFSGGYIGQTDSTFNSEVTSFNQGQHIAFPANWARAGSSRSSAAPPTARTTSRKIRSRSSCRTCRR